MYPLEIHSEKGNATQYLKSPLDVLTESPTTENIKLGIVFVAEKYGANPVCLTEIIRAESRFQNVCNSDLGCNSGIGLAQIIPKTAEYCANKLGKTIDPRNLSDNLECSAWLLANEGTRHWGYPVGDVRGYVNGMRWGSYDKWHKYCL